MPTKRMPVPKPPAARRKISTGKPRPTAAPASTTRSESKEHVTLWPVHRDAVNARFLETVASGDPIFETTATRELFPAYLAAMPHHAQYLNCSACRHFIRRYGGLVAVDERGFTRSAIWPDTPAASRLFYAKAEREMARRASHAKIIRPFLSSKRFLGQPHTNGWDHLCVNHAHPFDSALVTAGQMAAKKQEHMRMVLEAVNRFTPKNIQMALDLLQVGDFNRKEKFIAPLRWLLETREAYYGSLAYNILWRRVALAPEGYCHIGGSVIGQLLEDLQARKSNAAIQRRWNMMVNASNYQRPKAPPTAQNVHRADGIVSRLGIEASLRRRFATMRDVQPVWSPSYTAVRRGVILSSSVFADIEVADRDINHIAFAFLQDDPIRMTWQHFRREILSSAARMEFTVPGMDNYFAMTAAMDPTAPPIFKWDSLENRNTLSWYTYPGPTPSNQWGLRASHMTTVTGVVELPANHSVNGVILVLDGCKDSMNSGSALFPEMLRSELHEVRSTIEAYSNGHPLECPNLVDCACGVGLIQGHRHDLDCRVKVFTKSKVVTDYIIDRWD